ncbi:MAG TPA: hypothetical protein VGM93_01310, partial [Acidimicrobiales bacterium]
MLEQSAIGSAGLEIPGSLRAVVLDRVGRLGGPAVGPLQVAAVIGIEFDLSVVEAALPLAGLDPEPSALDFVERALDERIMEAAGAGDDTFRFVHDVVRDTVLSQLNPARQMRLHAAIGHAMIARWGVGGPQLAVIARHLGRSSLATDRTEAAGFVVELMRREVIGVAPDDAADLAAWALASLPTDAEFDEVRLDLLIALAGVHFLRLDHENHRQAVMQAVATARRLGGPVALARAVEPFRLVPRAGTTDLEVFAVVDEALAGLEGLDAVDVLALRARLGARLAYGRAIGGVGWAAAESGEHAVADARAAGDDASLALALHSLMGVLLGSPNVDRQLAAAAEMATLQARLPGGLDAGEGSRLVGTVRLQQGDRDGFEAERIRLGHEAEIGDNGFLRSMTTMWTSLSSLLDGSVGDAAAANDQLLAEAAGDPNVLLGWFGQVCAIRAEQDRVAELVPLAEQTVADHGDLPAVRAVTAWLLAAAGDTAGAWDLIEPLAAVGFRTVPNGWLLPGTLAALAPVVAER